MTQTINQNIRVPNLPIGPITDKDGNPTQNEVLFRQALVDLLQNLFGQEGVVSPAQQPSDITLIQNATSVNGKYTCLPGTIIYSQHPSDYTQDQVVVAYRNSNDPIGENAPLFKVLVHA